MPPVVKSAVAYYVRAVAYVSLWAAASVTLVMANSYAIRVDEFEFPMTISMCGPLLTFLVALVAVLSGHTKLTRRMTAGEYARTMLPVGVCTAFSLAIGNALYLYFEVSSVQLLKAFSPVVTGGMLVALGMDVVTAPKLCGVVMMTGGTALACSGMTEFSVVGFCIVLGGELVEGSRMVLWQHVLKTKKMPMIEGLLYYAPAAFVFLATGVAIFERDAFSESENSRKLSRKPHLYLGIGVLGALVSVGTVGAIQICGSLTFKALALVRNVVIILGAVIFYGDDLTFREVCGYLVTLSGFTLYQYYRTQEDMREIRATGYDAIGEGEKEGLLAKQKRGQ
jgi:hypothetical protein